MDNFVLDLLILYSIVKVWWVLQIYYHHINLKNEKMILNYLLKWSTSMSELHVFDTKLDDNLWFTQRNRWTRHSKGISHRSTMLTILGFFSDGNSDVSLCLFITFIDTSVGIASTSISLEFFYHQWDCKNVSKNNEKQKNKQRKFALLTRSKLDSIEK